MLHKARFAALFLGLLFAGKLEAAMVSFLVAETGLGEDSSPNQHSGLWESGLLDVFFEAGHIVSNAPVLRLKERPAGDFPDEAKADFDEAVEGGAEYFILALLEYESPARPDAAQKPRSISLRLYKTKPYQKLYEQEYQDGSSRNLKDEYDTLKKIIQGLVPRIK